MRTLSVRGQRHSPERAARNLLLLAIVASTGKTTVSGANPLVPPVTKNPQKKHAGRLLHACHTSCSSAPSDCRAGCGKAAGPTDPCKKSDPNAQRLQQGGLPALEDEVFCGHAFSVEGKRSQMHSLPLQGHLLLCGIFHNRGKEYPGLENKFSVC